MILKINIKNMVERETSDYKMIELHCCINDLKDIKKELEFQVESLKSLIKEMLNAPFVNEDFKRWVDGEMKKIFKAKK